MFKDHNIIPGNFNIICGPITELKTKKSDHSNGYFIVEGLWGSCFHRIATKQDRFTIVQNSKPNCYHTYTRIPQALTDRTYFIYVNFKEAFRLNMPDSSVIVGFHEAQPHKSGGWWSQSLIIYCPTGEPPTAEEVTERIIESNEVLVQRHSKEYIITSEQITFGMPVKYLAVNENGYPQKENTRPCRNQPATNSLAEFMTN